jgi:DNA-binding winged helix-turn-helix (wHTH) protein
MNPAAEAPTNLAFGRFQVLRHRRELLADGRPIKLGGRAFDLLMALIEARGAVIGKDTLMARVWPDRVVEENNLQAHISALRAPFGAKRALIRTVSGRGYQFTGEIRFLSASPDERVGSGVAVRGALLPPTNLPEPVSELIGRDDELREILSLAGAYRLVTLTGAGGIGKTRLAFAAGRRLRPEFADGVWLLELASLSDANLVPSRVAGVLRLGLGSNNTIPKTVAHVIGDRKLLLVLDNCEHLIGAAADLTETLLALCPNITILVTSREILRIQGECVYRVSPLDVPSVDTADLKAAKALLDALAVGLRASQD